MYMAQSTLVNAQVEQRKPVCCFVNICHTPLESMINTDKIDILLTVTL